MSNSRNTTIWKGQIGCWVKKENRQEKLQEAVPISLKRLDTHLQLQQITCLLFEGTPKAHFCSIFRNPYKQNYRKWEARMGAQRRDDKEKTEPQQTVVRTLWIYACNQSIHTYKQKTRRKQQGLICATFPVCSAHRCCRISLLICPFCVWSLKRK